MANPLFASMRNQRPAAMNAGRIRPTPQFLAFARKTISQQSGDPQQKLRAMNLTPDQLAQVRSVTSQLWAAMGGKI